jgi:spore germination cell wall hydrolase CwlJ-like protein
MNRLGHKGFPNTICGVVKQGHEQGACQFSCRKYAFPFDRKAA